MISAQIDTNAKNGCLNIALLRSGEGRNELSINYEVVEKDFTSVAALQKTLVRIHRAPGFQVEPRGDAGWQIIWGL